MVADENMMKLMSDPLTGVAGVKLYMSESIKILNTWQSLTNYFSEKGIIFGKNEHGYLFTSLLESISI